MNRLCERRRLDYILFLQRQARNGREALIQGMLSDHSGYHNWKRKTAPQVCRAVKRNRNDSLGSSTGEACGAVTLRSIVLPLKWLQVRDMIASSLRDGDDVINFPAVLAIHVPIGGAMNRSTASRVSTPDRFVVSRYLGAFVPYRLDCRCVKMTAGASCATSSRRRHCVETHFSFPWGVLSLLITRETPHFATCLVAR